MSTIHVCSKSFSEITYHQRYPVVDDELEDPMSTFSLKYPDAHLTTVQLATKYGYAAETHTVVTMDNYVLEVHRITGTKESPSAKGKRVVFLMHGLLSSSADWVIAGPGKALAYVMADKGYDVWMGNARGNTYSRRHCTLSTKHKNFWSFSWHEIGLWDLPATIDYILEVTGEKKLFYIGYSQGTTAFFTMASELPLYQDKIVAMFALAPVAFMKRIFSPPFKILARFTKTIEILLNLIGKYEFEPTSECMKKFAEVVCSKGAITQPLCANVLFMIAGFSYDQFNKTLLPTVLGHVPAGASIKQFVHYAQLINTGQFRQYDHGIIKNLVVYGHIQPPSYNLRSIKIPVSLHYSSNDWLANVLDVDKLYRQLGKPYGKFLVPHNKFNHLDFLWGNNVRELVYDKLVNLLLQFQ
ncbi:lipase 3-like [Prorops nasuta]|uniref:lipase 3-like n=1 Tax=Prorops nasuta TaxID=863751 RepID=UPI0034CD603C